MTAIQDTLPAPVSATQPTETSPQAEPPQAEQAQAATVPDPGTKVAAKVEEDDTLVWSGAGAGIAVLSGLGWWWRKRLG